MIDTNLNVSSTFNSTAQTRTVYDCLVTHHVNSSWDFREAALELYRWLPIFDFEFKLELPPIAIAIRKMSRRSCYGYFQHAHNELGLQDEIAIDERHVLASCIANDWTELLDTLLHETLHAWQQEHGIPGKGNYHNKEFREKAQQLGLIIDASGRSLGRINGSPFLQLLDRHSVEIPTVTLTERELTPKSPTKLKLWMCSCTKPIRLRIAKSNVRIRCEDCGQRFKMSMPSHPTRGRT